MLFENEKLCDNKFILKFLISNTEMMNVLLRMVDPYVFVRIKSSITFPVECRF